MNNSFLQALKTKSAAIQSTRDNTPKQPVKQPPLVTATQISRAIQTGQVKTTPKPIASIAMPQMVQDIKLITSVNVVANKNRLDVLFNRKPEQPILDSLKDQGFKYNPVTKAWYHKDNKFNRSYLALFFGADFPLEETEYTDHDLVNDIDPTDPDVQQSITLTAQVNEAPTPEESKPIAYTPSQSPNFERYKDQVNKLSEFHQLDPVDLMMLAIDALYTRTFNYN